MKMRAETKIVVALVLFVASLVAVGFLTGGCVIAWGTIERATVERVVVQPNDACVGSAKRCEADGGTR